MNWKQFLYKVAKGAASGALAGVAAVNLASIQQNQIVSVMTAAAIGGAIHGVTNAIEQQKAQ